MDHPCGLHRQRLQQFLVLGAERLGPVCIHVQHAAQLPGDFQRHGQLRARLRPQQNVPRVAPHVPHARRLACASHPASNAFADPQFEVRRVGRKTFRRVNLEPAVRRVDQHDRAAGSAHQTDGLIHNQLQRHLRLERAVNHAADLVQHIQPVVPRFQVGKLVAHLIRAASNNPVRPKDRLGNQAASQGDIRPLVPSASPSCCSTK